MTTLAMPAVARVQMHDVDRFVPVTWESHRADGVDPQHPVPVSDWDEAYSQKFDWTAAPLSHPLTEAGWVLDPLPVTATQHALATPGGTGPTHDAPPLIGGWLPCCPIGRPDHPGTPGVTTPDNPLPQPAPVPLPASGWALIVALVLVAAFKRNVK